MTAAADGTGYQGVHLLCLGLGYTARALARRVGPRGVTISGTARTPTSAAAITAEGWRGLVLDGAVASPDLAQALAQATHVLISAGPDATGDPILTRLGPALGRASRLSWVGYLSTIGVYGDRSGDWIDETTPPRDPGERGQRRLDAECAWLAFGTEHGKRVEVFRLPGIYGPGRSAVDQLLAGTARRIAKPGQVFNRIHVDDIAQALEAAMMRPAGHTIYNIVDDEPAPADEVVAYAAGLLGVPVPPLVAIEDAQLSPMAASFYRQSKRVGNRRMKAALGVDLVHPTYREGLAAIVRAMRAEPNSGSHQTVS